MHIERIQDLQITASKRVLLELFSKPAPAPLLRSLLISTFVETPGDLFLDLDEIMHPETPGLRALELICCDITSSSPFLSGLRSLKLINPPSRLSIPELSRLLRQMPHLVDLDLHHAIDCNQGSSLPRHVVAGVDLPLLRRFALRSPAPDAIVLLRHLRIPLSTEIRLYCMGQTSREFLELALLPVIAERFEHNLPGHHALPLPPIIRSLNVQTGRRRTGVTLVCGTLDCDFAHDDRTTSQWESGIPLKVELESENSSLFHEAELWITAIYCNLALSNLQYLSISSHDTFALSSSFWRDTFGHIQTLQAIKLTMVNLYGFVKALSPPRHGGSAERSAGREAPNQDLAPVMEEIPESLHSPTNDLPEILLQQQAPAERPFAHKTLPQVFAPALAEIHLTSVAFSLARPSRSTCGSVNFDPSLKCLRDALTRRKNAGFGLEKLVLADCINIPKKEVAELEEVVGEVQWNGVGRTPRSNGSWGGQW
ncbi:hypothetical protein HYDPIDRAFT_27638 [Hydnomerulius pinastri MD-312]|nr:hypothetical protein HYDPIDRAFT_27638 [Hydnomerulius pinastri MD-312]